jgi:hypothetical protein
LEDGFLVDWGGEVLPGEGGTWGFHLMGYVVEVVIIILI